MTQDNRDCTRDSFLDDVKEHKMRIVKDDGLYRHIRFNKSNDSCHLFDLITWPYHLCITGDMGTYTFSRIEDMFDFFGSWDSKSKYIINPSYWSEKVLSESRFGSGVSVYSEASFKRIVTDIFHDHIDCNNENKHTEHVIWNDLIDRVFSNCETEIDARQAIDDFSSHGLEFLDFFEYNLHEFTYHYTWCCFAIVRGIFRYKKAKEL